MIHARLFCLAFCFAYANFVAGAAVADDDARFENEVFVSGQEGYHSFRIPALVATAKGTLLAFCEGRRFSREDLGNNDLLLKRSTDGGRTWQKLQLVYEEGGDEEITIANPTVVIDQSNQKIWLIMQRNGRDVLVTHSADDGQTWAKPADITKDVKQDEWGFYAVGPGIGIQIQHGEHQGRLVIPAYHRQTRDKSGPSTSHIFYSDDHGQSWRLGGDVDPHTNECQVVETLADGKSQLLFNARNHWARSGGRPDLSGVRMIAHSDDGGQTWSKTSFDKTLVEPTCQASLARYSWAGEHDKSRILFSNPASTGRNTMTVRLSYDEGKTWPFDKLIYKGSSAYSSMAALADGRIGMFYERDDYAKITFTSFTLDWLTDGKDRVARATNDKSAGIRATENDQGVLFTEGDAKILFYQRATKSLDGKHSRANYIHPLYDLDGGVLTEDFPDDHPHHRGIFWAWHQLWVGDKKIGDGWECSRFAWDVKQMETRVPISGPASLRVKVMWKSPDWVDADGKEKPLIEENTLIRIHPQTDGTRAIDFEIGLLALENEMRLGGSSDDKGYGGFSVRVRLPDDVRFTGRDGELQPQRTAVAGGPWLDITASYGPTEKQSGLAILCHPSSPGFPQPWILRSNRSMQNPAYPGQHAAPLSTTQPTTLRYRLVLHRDEVETKTIDAWQAEYGKAN